MCVEPDMGRYPDEYADVFDVLEQHLRRLLPYVARGLTNNEIALELSLSKRTVETYLSDVMRRSGLRSRPRLMAARQSIPVGTGVLYPVRSYDLALLKQVTDVGALQNPKPGAGPGVVQGFNQKVGGTLGDRETVVRKVCIRLVLPSLIEKTEHSGIQPAAGWWQLQEIV